VPPRLKPPSPPLPRLFYPCRKEDTLHLATFGNIRIFPVVLWLRW
jgi:hypothetical protein